MVDASVSSTSYTTGQAVTLRSSTSSIDVYPDEHSGLGDPDAIASLWRSSAVFREGVLLASPSLARSAAALVDGPPTVVAAKALVKMHRSLLKYALRASTRPTPFGVFAGVAVLPTGDEDGEMVLRDRHHRRVQGSSALHRVLADRLRASQRALLRSNPALYRRGDRFVVPVTRGFKSQETTTSVRATAAVEFLLDLARAPRSRSELDRALTVRYPDQPRTGMGAFVDGLLENEVLVSGYDRSLFDDEPFDRLDGSDRLVAGVRAAIDGYASAPWNISHERLVDLLGQVPAQLAQHGEPEEEPHLLHVDTELLCDGEVPSRFRDDADDVVSLLSRATLVPPRDPALAAYAQRFEEAYGTCLVPILHVVDAERGLGWPTHYEDPSSAPPAVTDQGTRDRLQLRALLLERARRSGSGRVEITEQDVVGMSPSGSWASSYDVFLSLYRREGRLRSALTPIGVNFPGGRAVGRFSVTMPAVRREAEGWVRRDLEDNTGAVVAAVDCPSGHDGVTEVAATSPLHPFTVTVSGIPTDEASTRTIALPDLCLAVRGGVMGAYLRDGTPVHARQLSMVTPDSCPHVVRLLLEISHDGYVKPCWSWGPAEQVLSHLPEVRYRGVTIAPQAWRWSVRERPTLDSVREWLQRCDVSRYVLAGELDHRLHLDTHNPLHLDLLLAELSSNEGWVTEAPPLHEVGVVADLSGRWHCAELSVTVPRPLEGRRDDPSPPVPAGGRLWDVGAGAPRFVDVGGEWTYLSILVSRAHQERVLRSLASILAESSAEWYFVRYVREGREELRVRVKRQLEQLGGLLDAVASWRRDGTVGSISVRLYERELERYGGPLSFSVHERAFCVEVAATWQGACDLVDSTDAAGWQHAAGIAEAWLEASSPAPAAVDEVLELAVSGYGAELGEQAHPLRSAVRGLAPVTSATSVRLGAEMRGFWGRVGDPATVRDVVVMQSCLHMLCNRLGLSRDEEFSVLLMVQRSRTARRWRREAS